MEHNIASILLPQAAHIISCRSYVRGLKWNWSRNWCIFWLLKEHITGDFLLTLESVGEHYTSKITQYFLFRMLGMFPSAFYVRNSMYNKNLCCQNSQKDTAQPNNIWQNQTCNIRDCTTKTTWCDWNTLEGVLWPNKESMFEVFYFLPKSPPSPEDISDKS